MAIIELTWCRIVTTLFGFVPPATQENPAKTGASSPAHPKNYRLNTEHGLGWRGDVIKDYFLNYNECLSNEFVLSSGGARVEVLNRDIQDWSITFADTGISSNIGERLRAVEGYLDVEDVFLANYSDSLTDLHL